MFSFIAPGANSKEKGGTFTNPRVLPTGDPALGTRTFSNPRNELPPAGSMYSNVATGQETFWYPRSSEKSNFDWVNQPQWIQKDPVTEFLYLRKP